MALRAAGADRVRNLRRDLKSFFCTTPVESRRCRVHCSCTWPQVSSMSSIPLTRTVQLDFYCSARPACGVEDTVSIGLLYIALFLGSRLCLDIGRVQARHALWLRIAGTIQTAANGHAVGTLYDGGDGSVDRHDLALTKVASWVFKRLDCRCVVHCGQSLRLQCMRQQEGG